MKYIVTMGTVPFIPLVFFTIVWIAMGMEWNLLERIQEFDFLFWTVMFTFIAIALCFGEAVSDEAKKNL